MAINVSPDAGEIQALVTDLRGGLTALTQYLQTPAAKQDPNYSNLVDQAFTLNEKIADLAVAQLSIVGQNAGQAIDAINQATAALTDAINRRNAITKDLKFVQSLVSLAVAIVSGNPGSIISAAGSVVGQL
jgi:hypothetical protein